MVSRLPRYRLLVFLGICVAWQWSSTCPAAENGTERRWQIVLDGFFRGGTKPIYLYCQERDGEWVAVVGSSRDPDRDGRKTYNRSWYYADLSNVSLSGDRMQGRFTLHMTPDLWVPRDHKPYTIEFEIDASIRDEKLEGSYKVVSVNSNDESTRDFGSGGRVRGTQVPHEQKALPEPVTFRCNMQSALVGGDSSYGGRCMVLWLGLENGKLTSTIHGLLSQKHHTYARQSFEFEGNAAAVIDERLTAKIMVPARTLDMEPCRYEFQLDGRMMDAVLVGTYVLTAKIDGKPDIKINGSFDGDWDAGVTHLPTDDRPWFKSVDGFQTPKPGEHPRLLFRKSDLPSLRAKAKTPEGKAILHRLRYLLDGAEGETMTTVFSDATHAYMGGGYKNSVLDKPGVFTIGHVAGYGLLYQLTGDRKYAEFGAQCFEKSLAGVRDRDDRYSFVGPGGPLRAGPSLGWHAVGYDLCYDGWDEATRERYGRALAEYAEASSTNTESKKSTLEALARGTMPPGSNHFGMQVGGASLALLAVSGEEWVDQPRIDRLMAIAQYSMVRNVSEGFGDGGFFAEGDGTGSMASQISYLTAVQAWKNAAGKDFVNVSRPNIRMLTVKWIYQTVVRDGRFQFWPIRGSYGHNVWAREGLSGAGYFAIGFGGVTRTDQAAMRWWYNHFLLDDDIANGTPYDTASKYPHLAVCAFVNWPIDVDQKYPGDVLPHFYSDSSCGFYVWRNRWRDANDTVISVLTNRTEGYMSAKADKALMINAGGQRLRWGTVKAGSTTYWSSSTLGETSSLTLADGTCFGVDFSESSGAEVLLVTTGEAQGQRVRIGNSTLTFGFPTSEEPPRVVVKGHEAVVGQQRVGLKNGNLVFAEHGR